MLGYELEDPGRKGIFEYRVVVRNENLKSLLTLSL